MKEKKQDSKKEIENLKRLRDIEAMLQKSDIENAFVSNAAKDSETVNNDIADTILNRIEEEKINTKDINSIISFTSNKKQVVVKKNTAKKTKPQKAKPKIGSKKSAKAKPKKPAFAKSKKHH